MLAVAILAPGYYAFSAYHNDFKQLSPQAQYNKIISERTIAIEAARQAGNYRCCIEPACGMCYMNANQWNNYTPGTCACDDFVAKGEPACPECERGLADIHASGNNYCDIGETVGGCEGSQ